MVQPRMVLHSTGGAANTSTEEFGARESSDACHVCGWRPTVPRPVPPRAAAAEGRGCLTALSPPRAAAAEGRGCLTALSPLPSQPQRSCDADPRRAHPSRGTKRTHQARGLARRGDGGSLAITRRPIMPLRWLLRRTPRTRPNGPWPRNCYESVVERGPVRQVRRPIGPTGGLGIPTGRAYQGRHAHRRARLRASHRPLLDSSCSRGHRLSSWTSWEGARRVRACPPPRSRRRQRGAVGRRIRPVAT